MLIPLCKLNKKMSSGAMTLIDEQKTIGKYRISVNLLCINLESNVLPDASGLIFNMTACACVSLSLSLCVYILA